MVSLGRIFFQKYQLAFNFERKIILFYKDDLDAIYKNRNYTFIILLIIVLFIICIIIFYFYLKCFNKKKKIYAKELDEDIKLSEKII